MRLTEEQAIKLGIIPPKKSKSKYNARKVKIDGITFDSQAEADYYCKLKIMQKKGLINGFCRQARFLVIEGQDGNKCTEYVTDFVIFYLDGKYRIVDVKGMQTDVFKIKMQAFKEKYPKLKVELEE